jgi:hypothetical protein
MNGCYSGSSCDVGQFLQKRSRSEEATWMVKSPGLGDFRDQGKGDK